MLQLPYQHPQAEQTLRLIADRDREHLRQALAARRQPRRIRTLLGRAMVAVGSRLAEDATAIGPPARSNRERAGTSPPALGENQP